MHASESNRVFCVQSSYPSRPLAMSDWYFTVRALLLNLAGKEAGIRGTFRALTRVSTLYNLKAGSLCPLLRAEAQAHQALVVSVTNAFCSILPLSQALIPKTSKNEWIWVEVGSDFDYLPMMAGPAGPGATTQSQTYWGFKV